MDRHSRWLVTTLHHTVTLTSWVPLSLFCLLWQMPFTFRFIEIIDTGLYLEFDLFHKTYSSTAHTAPIPSEMRWSRICAIFDKGHKHGCGYSALSDMKMLLERNNILSNMANSYLDSVESRCETCRCTPSQRQAHKVSLASMDRQFNDVVCVDHCF